jgi:hypothetical protein
MARNAPSQLAASLAQVHDEGAGMLVCTGFVLRVAADGVWILTAAHCMRRSAAYSVRVFWDGAGPAAIRADDPRWHRIPPQDIRIHVHPGYSATTMRNDVALMFCRVRDEALLASLRPLPIRRTARSSANSAIVGFSIVNGSGDAEMQAERDGRAAGPTVLKTAPATLGAERGAGLMRHLLFDPRWHVWAAGAVVGEGRALDTCEGDSGGPLLDASGTFAIGVTSWGVECGDPDMPGVYARLEPLMGPEPAEYTLRRVRAGSPWQRGIEGVMAADASIKDPATPGGNQWADDPAKPTAAAALEILADTPMIVALLVLVVLLVTTAAAAQTRRMRTAPLAAAVLVLAIAVAALMVTYCL